MFAFALWDAPRRHLLLARDRMGEKPLYYHAGRPRSSSARSCAHSSSAPACANAQSREPLPLSAVRVHPARTRCWPTSEVPPGHFLTVSPGASPDSSSTGRPLCADDSLTESDWVERLQAQLEASVQSRLVSDVPLGAFLSADRLGTVVASRRRELAAAVSDVQRRLRAPVTTSVRLPTASRSTAARPTRRSSSSP